MKALLAGTISLALVLPAAPSGARNEPVDGLVVLQLLAPEGRPEPPTHAGITADRYPWRFPRATVDRPDRGGSRVHAVYLTTTDRPAPPLDRRGIIEDSVRAQDGWMREASGHRWRLDTFAFRVAGRRRPVKALDVTFVASGLRSTQLTTLADIRSVLVARGLNEAGKRYLVYAAVDAGSVCGEGEYPLSEGDVGAYSVVYLFSDAGCGSLDLAPDRHTPSWAETIAQQELMHNDGAVPMTAPHDCKPTATAHVCTPGLVATELDPETQDVMFPFASGPLSEKQLDLGRDDYFRHGLPYRDLADSPYLAPVRSGN